MNKQGKTYQILGDTPVLDILHICFQDLEYGRMTPRGRLYRLMLKKYWNEDKERVKNIIRNVTEDTNWFASAGPNIHLIERGVEVYVNMIQHYTAEKNAVAANRDTRIILYISLAALIVSIVLLMFEFIKK